MKKFYKSIEEIKEDNKEEVKEIVKELNHKENRQKTIIKIIKIVLIFLLFIILFKLIIGTITISSPLPYSKSRKYQVSINDDILTINVHDKHQIINLFSIVKLTSENVTMYYGEELDSTYQLKEDTSYNLSIDSYSCYLKKHPVETSCDNETELKEIKNNDTSYNLWIKKTGKDEITTYKGPFIENITPYLKEKGQYYIEITATYKNTKSIISLYAKKG